MKNINDFELAMLKIISKYYPFSIIDIQKSYQILKSFDKVIKAVEISLTKSQNLYSTSKYYDYETPNHIQKQK